MASLTFNSKEFTFYKQEMFFKCFFALNAESRFEITQTRFSQIVLLGIFILKLWLSV